MIKYIINKEKRTVVAVIEFEKDEETFVNSSYIYDDLSWALARLKKNEDVIYNKKNKQTEVEKMYFPRYMSAKAKCNPEDEWDEEYGKQLARQRLVKKIHNYRSNSYKIIMDKVREIRNFLLF